VTAGRDIRRGVLFLQIADPGYYPPLIHASSLMAEAGWSVVLLSAPITGAALRMPERAGLTLCRIAERPTHVVSKRYFATYALAAARLARRTAPGVIYASDEMSAGPALLARALTGAKLVYHEHDSPDPDRGRSKFGALRAMALRRADIVVFPNAMRARHVKDDVGMPDGKVIVVANVPRRCEIARAVGSAEAPLTLHYHGNISPDLLPMSVVRAILRMEGEARLQFAGYEAPGAPGYIDALVNLPRMRRDTIAYLGMLPRDRLLAQAARAHVGLALMPRRSTSINLRHATGASNKAFDYMAAGLSLMVSDLPDWVGMFVEAGYGRAVDPDNVDAVYDALRWFVSHPQERAAMAARARARIAADWNYDTAFAPVLERLVDG